MYQGLVKELGKEMAPISHEEFAEASEEIFGLGGGIKELPYCGLKKRHHHEYGTMKAWIKWKKF